MTIAYVNQGTVGVGTTTVQPGAPASMVDGNLIIIKVVTKPDTAVPVTPTDWTLLGDVAGGGGTTGNQIGPSRQTFFMREKTAGWSAMPTITVTNGNSTAAIASQYSKDSTKTWDVAATTGVFGVAATVTNCASTMGANPGIKPGDYLVVGYSNMDDGPTWSAQGVTATGVSAMGTVTERSEIIENTTGNDIGGMFYTVGPVATGTATAAPATQATASAATRGTVILARLREITPPLTHTPVDDVGLADAAVRSMGLRVNVQEGSGGGGGSNPRVAMVVDDIAGPAPSANDIIMRDILVADGMTVTYLSEAAAPPSDLSTYDVVVHTESGSSSGTAISAYPTMAVPLVFLETSWQAINMSSAVATNPTSTTDYDVIDTGHDIVSGQSDPFTWRTGASGNYGVTTAEKASGAQQICAPAGNTGHCTVLAAESGATLTSGTAPARRVCMGAGVGSAPASWTAATGQLLIQAVRWAANVTGGGGGTSFITDTADVQLSGGGPDSHTHTPTDNEGLTDSASVQLLGPPGDGPFQVGTATVEPESHGYVVPIIDSNGNWYRIAESQLAANNQPQAWKSTDDGETWTEMDAANRPGTDTASIGDLESGWVTWDAETKILTFIWQRSYVVWSGFRTSDHPTNPDTWVSNTRENMAALTGSPQYASSTNPTNQSYEWVFYNNSTTKPSYRSRSGSGSYGTQADVDSSGQHPAAIIDTNNISHILYRKATNQLHYKKLTSTGTLDGASTRVDTNSTHTVPIAHAAPQPWVNGGNTYVGCLFIDGNADLKFVLLTNGVAGSEETVTTNTVLTNPGATTNDAAIITLAVDPVTGTMYALWSEAATNAVMYAERPAGGAWSSPVAVDSPSFVPSWVYAKVNTRPDSSRVLGYTFSENVDDDNTTIWFNKVELTAGTGHTATPSDPIGITESVSITMGHAKPVVDSVGVTETKAFAQTHLADYPENMGVTETVLSALTIGVSAVDAEGLTDAAGIVQSHVRTQVDAVGLTDTPTIVQSQAIVQVDPVGLTDAAVPSLADIDAMVDPVGVTETILTERGQVIPVVDPVGLTDAAVVAQSLGQVRVDPVGLTDAAVQNLTDAETIVDPEGLTDSSSLILDRNVTDPVGVTETSVFNQNRSVVDPVGLTDAPAVAHVDNESFTDSVGITEDANVSLIAGVADTYVNPVGITDIATPVMTDLESYMDPVGITDTATVSLGHGLAYSDPLGLTDAALSGIGLTVPVTDPLGLTDAATLIMSGGLSRTDPLGLTDAAVVNISNVLLRSDAVGLTDSPAVVMSFRPTLIDPLGLTDSPAVALSVRTTLINPVGITDNMFIVLSSGYLVAWWDDGINALRGAEIVGWYDANSGTIQPAELLGWWDKDAGVIRPLTEMGV